MNKKIFFSLFLIFYSLALLHSYYPFSSFLKKDSVYITPGLWGWLGETGNHPGTSFYGMHLPTIFKKYGLKIKTAKQIKKLKNLKKLIVFEVIEDKAIFFKKYPSEKMVLFLWEPPTVFPQNYEKKYHKYFSKIYTYCDDLVDNKKYFKFFYPELKSFSPSKKSFREKKLCTLICRNKSSSHLNELYSERKKIVHFFEERAQEDFDLFGYGWSKEENVSYRGTIDTKQVLHDYKFCICYENIKDLSGYITEKIFDAFHFGCVPVYLGADNMEKYIPKSCYIDRRKFSSDEDLYSFLKNVSEMEYVEYLKNIEIFLQSEEAKVFSPDNFLKILKKVVNVSD